MFNFLRRSKPSTENTFKSRVDRFWEWFSSQSEQMLATIDDGRCGDLATATNEQVEKLGAGFGWVFGPGSDGTRHSFTWTGEGVVERQILAQYWKARAPKLAGWTIYSSRQHSAQPPDWTVEMYDESFSPTAFWCSVFVNEQDEKFDITVWHPLFPNLPENDRFRILFIVLDELFGEFGTQRWLGEIKITDARLADSMPIGELRDFVHTEVTRHKWELVPPGESATFFEFHKSHDFPRGDTLTWITAVPSLVEALVESEGKPPDLLEGTGAEFLFLRMPIETFPRGEEVAVRTEIEDAMDAALNAEASGRVVGGAFAPSGGYIDILTYDGSTSVAIIEKAVRKLALPEGTALFRFVKPEGPPLFQIKGN